MTRLCWCGTGLTPAGLCSRDATHAQAEFVAPRKPVPPVRLDVFQTDTPIGRVWLGVIYETASQTSIVYMGPSHAETLAEGLRVLAKAYDWFVDHQMAHLAEELKDLW